MPYFYSTSGAALLLRRSDALRFGEALQQFGEDEGKLRNIAIELLTATSPAPDGTRFDLWANLRCGLCGFEFPYNNGVQSVARRISDSTIVVADGTVVIGDVPEECYILHVEA